MGDVRGVFDFCHKVSWLKCVGYADKGSMSRLEIIHIPVIDDHGKRQTIECHRVFVDTHTFAEPDGESFDEWFFTTGRLVVNRIDEQTFQVRDTGAILRKV